ncbi:MAG: hypothetical protein JWP81_2805 [Ferruginibacter sp.]|nr:hypothetical protein [Ferruginibacter sp.]
MIPGEHGVEIYFVLQKCIGGDMIGPIKMQSFYIGNCSKSFQ